ncbi:YcxB family protein [Streptomyces sp. DT24]|uniref:YcxB family protein n=1 Tax=unclassified Streptomyces TaxID=2593676 RepID=UPI0023B957E8|nr:YcxB family protein [Streptomyces sp. AM 4-1-1]WEH33280.1 YcxB family protein [Streptomyces sp. AM 4-1-1]
MTDAHQPEPAGGPVAPQAAGTAAGAVELEFRPTVQDLTEALRARNRVGAAGRRQRLLLVLSLVLGVAYAVGAGVAGLNPLPGGVLLVVAFALLLSPWLQARQFHRMFERQGGFRARADETGLTLSNDNSVTTTYWRALPRFVETPNLFVLVSDDRNAVGMTVLAKRGVRDEAELDRLRAILDRHLQRR